MRKKKEEAKKFRKNEEEVALNKPKGKSERSRRSWWRKK